MDVLDSTAQARFGISYPMPFQRLAITNILEAADRDNREEDSYSRQIIILPTGSGKSLCYMLPALLMDGLTVLVFPLIALMNDQLRRLEEAGIGTELWKGGQNRNLRRESLERLRSGESRILITNPEILKIPGIRKSLKELDISHIVLDEVHTIADWGETFRPAMLDLPEFFRNHPLAVLTAFTATASPAVLKRIQDILFANGKAHLIQGNPDRPNMHYRTVPTLSKKALLPRLIRKTSEPLLIFCSSRNGTMNRVLELRHSLKRQDIFFYHAGLTPFEKKKIEDWFFEAEEGILIATCAYGMGVDKSNIRTVIHADLPLTAEAFLQETGRAGRDRQPVETILLVSQEDVERIRRINDPYLKQRAFEMLNYAGNTTECRRENIFALFHQTSDGCNGCDICDEDVMTEPPEWLFFSRFFRYYDRQLSLKEAVLLLKGLEINRRFPPKLFKPPAFGALKDWNLESIEEAIQNLIWGNHIKVDRFWWKDKLVRRTKMKEWPGFTLAEDETDF